MSDVDAIAVFGQRAQDDEGSRSSGKKTSTARVARKGQAGVAKGGARYDGQYELPDSILPPVEMLPPQVPGSGDPRTDPKMRWPYVITAPAVNPPDVKPITGMKLMEDLKNGRMFKSFSSNYRYWKPALKSDERPKAMVFIAHDFGEHSKYYEEMGKYLASKRFLAFSHDMIGHGKTRGEPCYINTFEILTSDIIMHVELAKIRVPGIPVFAVGHSLGGTVVLLNCLDRTGLFKGVVLIAPAIERPMFSMYEFMLAKCLDVFHKHVIISKPIDYTKLSRDPNVIKRYREDEKVYHEGFKVRPVLELTAAMKTVKKRANEMDIPFLIQHGDRDEVCDIASSRQFLNRAPVQDKKLTEYRGCAHRLFLEPNGDGMRCIKELTDWIEERVGPPPDEKDCLPIPTKRVARPFDWYETQASLRQEQRESVADMPCDDSTPLVTDPV